MFLSVLKLYYINAYLCWCNIFCFIAVSASPYPSFDVITQPRQLGAHLYQLLFEECPAPVQRQELIVALVSHTSSHQTAEVDTAMTVLYHLVCSQNEAMLPFSSFLLSLLDSIHSMSENQCRFLFLMLFALSLEDDDIMGQNNADDVHIVIRKYLSHSSISMKRIVSIFCCVPKRYYLGGGLSWVFPFI